jgi:ADP-ribose pyrophosphatase YjhB (NUDIX family)
MGDMISVPVGAGLFNFRAAGVWLHEEHALLQGDSRVDFWALPGGRVEFMEAAEVTLLRELGEELAMSAETRIVRLLWINQHFFNEAWCGEQHELCLYFLIAPTAADLARLGDTTRDHPCAEPDSPLSFRWFALNDLSTTRPLKPPFLNTALLDLPTTPRLITHNGR